MRATTRHFTDGTSAPLNRCRRLTILNRGCRHSRPRAMSQARGAQGAWAYSARPSVINAGLDHDVEPTAVDDMSSTGAALSLASDDAGPRDKSRVCPKPRPG